MGAMTGKYPALEAINDLYNANGTVTAIQLMGSIIRDPMLQQLINHDDGRFLIERVYANLAVGDLAISGNRVGRITSKSTAGGGQRIGVTFASYPQTPNTAPVNEEATYVLASGGVPAADGSVKITYANSITGEHIIFMKEK